MTITKANPTVLSLVGMGVPPYSARGLSQTLTPIAASQHLERTINGELVDFSYEPMQKYKSTISGNDQMPPACDGVWSGKIIEVECIAELCTSEYALLGRTAVLGSLRDEAGFTTYRPKLTMMVVNFSQDQDEYGRQIGWSLELEEV